MTRIIGIAGKAESGKDLAAGFITTVYPRIYYRRAFADALKVDAVRAWCEAGALPFDMSIWESLIPQRVVVIANQLKEGNPDFRTFLQESGERRRAEEPLYWVDRLFRDHAAQNSGLQLVIPDVRYKNELEAIVDRGGSVLRLERIGHENRLTPEQRNHSSETDLDDQPLNGVYRFIENRGEPVHLLKQVLAEVDAANGWRR